MATSGSQLKRDKETLGTNSSPNPKRQDSSDNNASASAVIPHNTSDTVTMSGIESMMQRMMTNMRKDIADDMQKQLIDVKTDITGLKQDVAENKERLDQLETRLSQAQETTTPTTTKSASNDTA